MIGTILACMLAVGSPVQDCNDFDKKKDNSTNEYSYDVKSDDFWDSKRSFRIGYELHNFQTESATSLPVKLGVGLSRVRQAWFHKKPIGGIMKFSFEYGLDLNYSMFETNITDDGYNGPTGFIGTEDPYYSEETEEGEVLGVVVVAEGAGRAAVDAKIMTSVEALFGIEAHKISIVKMRSQEVGK
jgi:hypothetical protein